MLCIRLYCEIVFLVRVMFSCHASAPALLIWRSSFLKKSSVSSTLTIYDRYSCLFEGQKTVTNSCAVKWIGTFLCYWPGLLESRHN